ncbi:2192_t:CDS:2, partial [Acaulospora colombiana]
MPASPKLRPRRDLPHITLEHAILLLCFCYFAIYDTREQYDLSFLEDNDEDIIPKTDRNISYSGSLRQHRSSNWDHRGTSTSGAMDGLVHIEEQEGSHPLLQIISHAEQEWKNLMDARPSSLKEAYDTYHRAYGRPPPSSYPIFFDILPRQCPMPSLDSINLYKPIPPRLLRKTQASLEGSPMTTTMIIRKGRVGSGMTDSDRGLFYARTVSQPLANLLSEITEPLNPFPAKLRADMDDLSRLGEEFDDNEGLGEEDTSGFYDFRDWMDACAREDPVQMEVQDLDTTDGIKFIREPGPLSPCRHPDLLLLSDYFAGPAPEYGILHPIFAFSRTALHGDILLPRPGETQPRASKKEWDQKQNAVYW